MSTLFGREALGDRLAEILRDRSRRGATLVGPAGVGKSALIRHVADRLDADHDIAWISGRTATSDIPLAAFSAYLPPHGTEPGLASFIAIREALTNTTDGRPRLVVVDDAHSLDETSAALLHQLVAHGITALVTQRSGAPASDSITRLWRDQTLERIDVDPLDATAVSLLVADILRGPVDPRSAHEVWSRTGGNPLYVRELVIGSQSLGEWSDGPSGWRWTAGTDETPRLADLLGERLDRLVEDEREAVVHLAFAEPMGIGEFISVCPEPVLERLERLDLITADVDRRRVSIRFAHPLLADLIRRTTTPLRARLVRGALFDNLLATGARRRDDQMRLAVLAVDAGRTFDSSLLVRAARTALAGDEHAIALRLAQAAFEDDPTFETGRILADVLAFDGTFTEISAHWPAWSATANDIAERGVISMHQASTLYYRGGDLDAAFDALGRTLDEVPAGDLSDEIAAVSAALDVAHGRIDDGIALARPLLEGSTNGRVLAQAALAASLGLRARGAVETALGITAASMTALAEHDGADGLIPKSVFSALETAVLVTAGRFVEAVESAERSIDRCRAAGAIASEALSHMLRAEACAMLGRFLDATDSIRDARAAVVHSDRAMYRSWVLAVGASVAALAGDREGAVAMLAERTAFGPHPSRLNAHHVTIVEAVSEFEHDRSGVIEAVIDDARRFAEAGDVDAGMRCLYELTRLGADDAHQLLADWAAGSESELHRMMADHAAALAARDVDALTDVAERLAATGAMVYAARALRQAAETAAGLGDDRRRARLDLAASTWEQQFQSLSPDASGGGDGTAGRPRSSSQAGLTRREREIALLAAQGLASRAIGDRLFLSPRTVDNHLAKAYGKLGVGNRAELAHVLATA